MNNVIYTIVAVTTLIVCGMGASIPMTMAQPQIHNDQYYIGDDGSLHIVGEIVNDLEMPLGQASVHIVLFDDAGNTILTKETNSLVNTIMPGMRGPFDLIVPTGGDEIYSYTLELDYKVSLPKNQVIDITNSELSRDRHSNLMITGTVANKGEMTANIVAVVATLYDNDGNVAAVSRVHPTPDYLRASDETFFLVSIPDKWQTAEINRYSLVAESEEYAAVPEFPVGSILVLVTTLSVYIGIIRFSRGFTITNLISATHLK